MPTPTMTIDKHPDFKVLERDPFNGGAPAARLVEHFLTPTDQFFVRNHAPIPDVDAAAYRLSVEGLVKTPLSLSLDDLRRDFERVRLVAAMQCAGNRRVELQRLAPIPGELIWDTEAVGNAEWSGWRLRDVLHAAGVAADDGDLHAAFEGLDMVAAHGQVFGGSIPLSKALHGDVLLADMMNGAPLPPAHGYPLRVVVPGYIGARSVKWLARIIVQEQPSHNYYQARAYKLFAGHVTPESVDWAAGMMLGELNVNAIIAQIVPGAGGVIVRGIAVAGERQVERVEVSADGTRWTQAELIDPPTRYGWRRWQARLALEPGEHEIMARAWDSAAATQPERLESVWNFKGYMNNAWHRVRVTVAG
jgi:sulfite oxidase